MAENELLKKQKQQKKKMKNMKNENAIKEAKMLKELRFGHPNIIELHEAYAFKLKNGVEQSRVEQSKYISFKNRKS